MAKTKARNSRKVIEEFVIPKRKSRAFIVKKGQVLRVIAHEGKQVADIRFLNAHDYREQFAAGYSASLNSNFDSIKGVGGAKRIQKLYSKPPWENVMLTVVDDKVGDHFFASQCTPKRYELLGKPGHLSCADLFDECLKPYHLSMVDLDSAGVFNLFMAIRYADDENGTIHIQRPSCEKGDYIEFLAEMDVLVLATSCPCDTIVNDYKLKGMKYQIKE